MLSIGNKANLYEPELLNPSKIRNVMKDWQYHGYFTRCTGLEMLRISDEELVAQCREALEQAGIEFVTPSQGFKVERASSDKIMHQEKQVPSFPLFFPLISAPEFCLCKLFAKTIMIMVPYYDNMTLTVTDKKTIYKHNDCFKSNGSNCKGLAARVLPHSKLHQHRSWRRKQRIISSFDWWLSLLARMGA